MEFNYSARNKENKIIEGKVKAINQVAAISILNRRGLSKIKIASSDLKLDNSNFNYKSFQIKDLFSWGPDALDFYVFFVELQMIVSSSFPLQQGLFQLSKTIENKKLKEGVLRIYNKVSSGENLSTAIKDEKIFPRICGDLIYAGERSSHINESLEHLYNHFKTQSKISRLLSEPIFKFKASFIILNMAIFGMIYFLLPALLQMVDGKNIRYSSEVKFLIEFVNFTTEYYYLYPLMLVFSVYGYFYTTKKYITVIDKIKLKIPFFNRYHKELLNYEFANIFYLTRTGDIKTVEALQITADVVSNSVFKKQLQSVASSMTGLGVELGQALEDHASNILHPRVINFIKIGEASCKLHENLPKLVKTLEDLVQQEVEKFSRKFSLVITMVIGIAIVIYFYLYWSLNSDVLTSIK